ncbi:hypothetical protein [Sorangium sp. So ce131]|uniref:hypothetical protein n=1 Tax=Sorangium sp. So ce131 TaxID=3133282 RepID=UPI003F610F7E
MGRSTQLSSLTGGVLAAASLTVALTIDGSDDPRKRFDHHVSGLVASVEDEAGSGLFPDHRSAPSVQAPPGLPQPIWRTAFTPQPAG